MVGIEKNARVITQISQPAVWVDVSMHGGGAAGQRRTEPVSSPTGLRPQSSDAGTS